jgi:UDP-N-acetylglucosamine transferase subunit ALG13
MIAQLPKIKAAIDFERNWLQQVIASHQIDVVISDNRLGLCNKAIQSVIITHQLGIQSGNLWLDRLIQKVNYHFINQFSECWVPDFEGENNIAGELSHPHIMPKIPVEYIGTLSRFTKIPQEKKYKKVIVLSGPEPQRTILENILIVQLKNYPETSVLVRGLPNDSTVLKIDNPLITVHNHLEATALSILMQQADCVIARSGYSTIMDLLAIDQPALLIPTPGQTEQLYLAKYLSEKKLFKSVSQEEFEL